MKHFVISLLFQVVLSFSAPMLSDTSCSFDYQYTYNHSIRPNYQMSDTVTLKVISSRDSIQEGQKVGTHFNLNGLDFQSNLGTSFYMNDSILYYSPDNRSFYNPIVDVKNRKWNDQWYFGSMSTIDYPNTLSQGNYTTILDLNGLKYEQIYSNNGGYIKNIGFSGGGVIPLLVITDIYNENYQLIKAQCSDSIYFQRNGLIIDPLVNKNVDFDQNEIYDLTGKWIGSRTSKNGSIHPGHYLFKQNGSFRPILISK